MACLVFSIGGPEEIVQSIENVNEKCNNNMLVIDFEKYCVCRHNWDIKFLCVFVDFIYLLIYFRKKNASRWRC